MTNQAQQRLEKVIYDLISGQPFIIQGPPSSSKSITVRAASILVFDKYPLSFALSKQTDVSDLIGRKLLQQKGTSSLTFVYGVLARAYSEGRVLLLDEFDLCPPTIPASLTSWLDHDMIEVNGKQILKNGDFRIIGTLNGNAAGRSEYKPPPSEVLARFRVDNFEGMSKEELKKIFENKVQNPLEAAIVADIHFETLSKLNSDKIVTLRNFNAFMALSQFGNWNLHDALFLSYVAQFSLIQQIEFLPYYQSF